MGTSLFVGGKSRDCVQSPELLLRASPWAQPGHRAAGCPRGQEPLPSSALGQQGTSLGVSLGALGSVQCPVARGSIRDCTNPGWHEEKHPPLRPGEPLGCPRRMPGHVQGQQAPGAIWAGCRVLAGLLGCCLGRALCPGLGTAGVNEGLQRGGAGR